MRGGAEYLRVKDDRSTLGADIVLEKRAARTETKSQPVTCASIAASSALARHAIGLAGRPTGSRRTI